MSASRRCLNSSLNGCGARADLTVAQMVENEAIDPEIIAFHAQQSVEKSLKALLVLRQIDFPRTHVIGMLLTLCSESGYVIDENLSEASVLSRYAVAGRYPGQIEPIDREEAKLAVDLADQVYQWAERQIKYATDA